MIVSSEWCNNGVAVVISGGIGRAVRARWFQAHVAAALHRPLIVLFEQECADEPGNGVFVGKIPTTSVRCLISH